MTDPNFNKSAKFIFRVEAESGYEATGEYRISPDQYRQVVAALEGTLKEAAPVPPEALAAVTALSKLLSTWLVQPDCPPMLHKMVSDWFDAGMPIPPMKLTPVGWAHWSSPFPDRSIPPMLENRELEQYPNRVPIFYIDQEKLNG
jgi:hypothetical protein